MELRACKTEGSGHDWFISELRLADCGFACLAEHACWCESELEHTGLVLGPRVGTARKVLTPSSFDGIKFAQKYLK